MLMQQIRNLSYVLAVFNTVAAVCLYLVGFLLFLPHVVAMAVIFGVVALTVNKIHSKTLNSLVQGHEGPCVPVWLNRNQVDFFLTGAVTGFFRRAVKVPLLPIWRASGPEFHGYIKNNGTVGSTEGHYSGPLPQ